MNRSSPSPRSLAKPGSDETIDIRSLKVALSAATDADEGGWVEMVMAGWKWPDEFYVGEEVPTVTFGTVVEFVSERIEGAVHRTAEAHAGLVRLGHAEDLPAGEIAVGMGTFVHAAREWFRDAGDTLTLSAEPGTINDPTIPG